MRSDPLENLSSYVMVHGGIDRHERLLDIEWIKDVLAAARKIAETVAPTEQEQDRLIDNLRRELNRDARHDYARTDLPGDEDEDAGDR